MVNKFKIHSFNNQPKVVRATRPVGVSNTIPCELRVDFLLLLLGLVHSVNSCLMPPTEQTGCVNIRMSVIFIIRYLL